MSKMPEGKTESLPNVDEKLHYAALATNVQFRALGYHLQSLRIEAVPIAVARAGNFRLSSTYSRTDTKKWLCNAWNTELVLRQQLRFDDEAKKFALQWAFSQAYYACFCQVLAMFAACGQTERSHASVVKRFGQLTAAHKYPDAITCFANGGMNNIEIHGVRRGSYPSPIYLELHEPRSVENQIAQLLKSTRERALKEKRDDFNFMTKDGRPRKSLNAEQWTTVSEKLGPTTILSILLRKRIKANYREIDTFLREEISGRHILAGLIRVVQAFALVHESILYSVLPADERTALTAIARTRYSFLHNRLAFVDEKLASLAESG